MLAQLKGMFASPAMIAATYRETLILDGSHLSERQVTNGLKALAPV